MRAFSHFPHFHRILLASRVCHTQGSHIIKLAASLLHMWIHSLAPFNCSSPSCFSFVRFLSRISRVTHLSHAKPYPSTHSLAYFCFIILLHVAAFYLSASLFLHSSPSHLLAFARFFRLSSHSARVTHLSHATARFATLHIHQHNSPSPRVDEQRSSLYAVNNYFSIFIARSYTRTYADAREVRI
jgi:hypothetical protein